ncbi:MAG: hypothetical protein CM15mP116_00090 [Synechococcus sp.]|nr:MAG: hypothetical protein CM15mP116_00090 [Synechococcus sp.]
MPNALLEAMAVGLAVVVTDASPGPLEVVEAGVSGLVVPSDEPAALADALDRLAAQPQLRSAWVLRRAKPCVNRIGLWWVRSGSRWWISDDLAALTGFAPTRRAASETFVRANLAGLPFEVQAYFGDEYP